jgi:ESS family glutamate:Na+ symporter
LSEEVGADGANDINHLVLLRTIAIIHAAILLGYGMDLILKWLGINMPLFVSALIMAMAIANIVPLLFPKAQMPARTRGLALISDLSLDLFLALSLMSMQLWQLAGVGLPILILFAAHAGLVVAYILVLVFPLMGRNYDAAVISSGFTGIGLGSTATAFANMSAITAIHGSSRNAFIILSLVAALFLDVANSTLVALIIRLFN